MSVKYGMKFSLVCIDSSMDFSLCFWDGSFIPLTFSWKVAGIDVFNVQLSVVLVVEVGAGSGRLDEHLFAGILADGLVGRLSHCLSSFLQERIEFGAVGCSVLAASSCTEAGCLGLLE